MRILLALLLVSFAAVAEEHGGAHHASFSDLIAPIVNVVILAAFLIWKLKTPMSNMFKTKAQTIKETVERAEIKAKEAQMLMEASEKKMANLTNEIKEIQKHAEQDVVTFQKNYTLEIDHKTEKLKEDSIATIDAERKEMLGNLSEALVDEVIKKTKSKVKNNPDLNKKAGEFVLGSLKQ